MEFASKTNDSKNIYSKVKELKSGHVQKVHNINIKDSSGILITNENGVRNGWKQYCSELYNYELNVDKAKLDQL